MQKSVCLSIRLKARVSHILTFVLCPQQGLKSNKERIAQMFKNIHRIRKKLSYLQHMGYKGHVFQTDDSFHHDKVEIIHSSRSTKIVGYIPHPCL